MTAHDGQKHKGRLLVSGTTATFEEESTHFRVTVPNEVESFRIKDRDRRICAVLRDKHLMRNGIQTRADRNKHIEEQLPKSAEDLHITGEDDQGNLRYSWKDVEILVKPMEKRIPLPEIAGKAAIARANESTPDQALRKIKEKVRRMLTKASKGECERIIAKNNGIKSFDASMEDQVHDQRANAWPTHKSPALGKLDDHFVQSHLRDAFSYVNTMKVHYCVNCDEHWPTFTSIWPKGGGTEG